MSTIFFSEIFTDFSFTLIEFIWIYTFNFLCFRKPNTVIRLDEYAWKSQATAKARQNAAPQNRAPQNRAPQSHLEHIISCRQNRRYTLKFSNFLIQLKLKLWISIGVEFQQWGLILFWNRYRRFPPFLLLSTWVFNYFFVCFRNQDVEVGQ